MSLPRYQNVRKVEGIGLQFADLLKQLLELKNQDPLLYPVIIEKILPFIQVEYVPIFIEIMQPIEPQIIEVLQPPTGGGLEFVTIIPVI